MMRFFHFLVESECDRTSLQHKGDAEHPIGPLQVCWRMRMRELINAFVDRVSRTNAKNENSCNERPEKPFLSVTERMLLRCWSFIKPQTQQKKDLVCRIGNRVECLRHHAGRAGDDGSPQFQYRDQSVGKERANNGQHISDYRGKTRRWQLLGGKQIQPQITQIRQMVFLFSA